jgi:tRNA modification GTPase
MTSASPAWWWSTAHTPGAIAVAHLDGEARILDDIVRALTGNEAPRIGEVVWRRFGSIDDGVIARTSAHHALLMPHGGTRIRELLDARLTELGARAPTTDEYAHASWPEAADSLECAMLNTLAHAASPMAVDLLAAQPARWREHAKPDFTSNTLALPSPRDLRLRRLITPARVVVTGPTNAGKSTLLNALAGRAVAIAHHTPGTTRDAVAARIDLAGLVVDWFDTPGVRADMDPIERAATELAARALACADLVIELTAPGLGWHAIAGAASALRMRVLNQSDRADARTCPERNSADLAISAHTGAAMDELVARVRDALVPPADMADSTPWRFMDGLPALPTTASA